MSGSLKFAVRALLLAATIDAVSGTCDCIDRTKVKAVAVYHGQKTNKFWQGVKKASELAATTMGINLTVVLFDKYNEDQMVSELKKQGAASPPPSFLVTSITSDKVFNTLKELKGKFPIFTMNVGYDRAKEIGSINFVGQHEFNAGNASAQRLYQALPAMKKGFFINPENGNAAMTARSAGMRAFLKANDMQFEEIVVDHSDMEAVKKVMQEKLKPTTTTGVLIGGNSIFPAVLEQLQQFNDTAAMVFDTNVATYKAIQDGKLVAAVEQQSWLQGYLPVVLGTIYVTTGEQVAQQVMESGPDIVTKPTPTSQSGCVENGLCDPSNITVAVITHALTGNAFWNMVQAGADTAAKDMGVKLVFPRLDTYDGMEDIMSKAILAQSNAGASLAVSIPGDKVNEAIKTAAAKVPLMTLNSGGKVAFSLGSLNHIGQDEVRAGMIAGQTLLKTRECSNPICLVAHAKNQGLTHRCDGFKAACAAAGKVMQDMVKVPDVASATAIARKTPDCVLITDSFQMLPRWLAGVAGAGTKTNMTAGSFDVVPGVAESLANSSIAFVVDQQPFLQGYLPVMLLTLKTMAGQGIVDQWIRAGPDIRLGADLSVARQECVEAGFPVCKATPITAYESEPSSYPVHKQSVGANINSPSSTLVQTGVATAASALVVALGVWRVWRQHSGKHDASVEENLLE